MPYCACDVAEFIIFYCHTIDFHISNLKLQKLLYSVYEEYVKSGKECFSDEIEYWDCGPVFVNVYRKFKVYSGGNIPWIIAKDPSTIDDNDKLAIASIIDKHL